MRRSYSKLMVTPLSVSCESGFLAGSITAKKISAGSVTVDNFDNGFDSGSKEDWTLTF